MTNHASHRDQASECNKKFPCRKSLCFVLVCCSIHCNALTLQWARFNALSEKILALSQSCIIHSHSSNRSWHLFSSLLLPPNPSRFSLSCRRTPTFYARERFFIFCTKICTSQPTKKAPAKMRHNPPTLTYEMAKNKFLPPRKLTVDSTTALRPEKVSTGYRFSMAKT